MFCTQIGHIIYIYICMHACMHIYTSLRLVHLFQNEDPFIVTKILLPKMQAEVRIGLLISTGKWVPHAATNLITSAYFGVQLRLLLRL